MVSNEQKSAFRSRNAQEDSLTYHLGGLQAAKNFRLLARAFILEAEARGAAEERANGAEGWKVSGWVHPDQLEVLHTPNGARDGERFCVMSLARVGSRDIPLYTRPANVAALEAQKSDEWEPIASAPKNGTLVDLWVRPIWNGKARRVIDAWWTDRTGWRSGTEVPIEGKVTFWRACPPAPGNSLQVQVVAPASDPIKAMTDDQLSERLKAVQARWDELMESEEELGSGSPLESMDEEMQSLENEIARRAALTREGGV